MIRTLLSSTLLALLSACTADPAPATPASPPAPVADQPAADVPPATMPAPDTPPMDPEGTQARGPDGDAGLARFDGYGDIRFGTAAADMAQAWGGELKTLGKDDNPSCYFMTPTWVKTPADFNFMVGDGKFARFGTESAKFAAPGGGKVGMRKDEVERLYAGRVEAQPHKYSDGQYLRIRDDAGGQGVLVFETDGKAGDAKVTEWRVGVAPQVDYVEGCS